MELRLYASVFLVNDNDELLLVRESKKINENLWNLPGGKLEIGEDFFAAAIREAKEEAGIDVVPTSIMKIFYGSANDSLHCVFLAKEFSGVPTKAHDMLDIAWTPLSTVETMSDALVKPEKLRILIPAYRAGKTIDVDIFAQSSKLL